MKKSLLLVFIHGFKGGDDTFGDFPNHLRALVSHALPKINVQSMVYPQFETRGDLTETVARFKDWLQNKVIDIEVENKTPSPTIDPSVRVILVGHSMGGIVAAETLLSIARDTPIPSHEATTPPPGVGNNTTTTAPTSASNSTTNLNPPEANVEERASSAPPNSRTAPTSNPDEGTSEPVMNDGLMFPYIQAILAFDTPYLGIHPGVVAHGAETHFNTASSAYKAYTTATKFFGSGGSSNTATPSAPTAGALPAAGGSGWGRWGRYGLVAGGVAAVAAAGAGAWMNRDHISEGWSWVFSHLEFVGCLARGADLTQRVDAVVRMEETHGVGFADLYTALGNDKIGQTKYSAQFLGEQRTFCVVPERAAKSAVATATGRSDSPSPNKKRKMQQQQQDEEAKKQQRKSKGTWIRCTNAKAGSETGAHVAMFTPKDNPDYHAMGDRARGCIEGWIDTAWYEGSSTEEAHQADAGVEDTGSASAGSGKDEP
ncbi:hypothetical protein AAFC00_002753 [Neodothiora populina]|uniref:DUF676 domain-containing protein n=1 Tax=Neodothiora populina TaxID=2781224 RepID=A0ABR3P9G2_9PEZI